MVEKIEKSLEENKSSTNKETKEYVPAKPIASNIDENPDQDLDKSLADMDKPEAYNNYSAEYIGNKTSNLFNSMKTYFKQAQEKLKDKAPEEFTSIIDGKKVSVSIHQNTVSGYADYRTNVAEFILRINVYDQKTSNTTSWDISVFKEKWSDNWKKANNYVWVKIFSGNNMIIKEACKYGDEFESAQTAEKANYFLWLAEKISSECTNIINEKIHSWDSVETSQIDKLLNKPNMTEKDKTNMRKVIELLKSKKIFTQENFKKLEAINYGIDHIEIWGTKRTRKNMKAEPDGKGIFKYENEVYFKYRTLATQNKLLETKWMTIPTKNDFIKSFSTLPWYNPEWVLSAQSNINILWTILNLSMSGSYNGYGKLSLKDEDNAPFREIWSITPATNKWPNRAYKYREENVGCALLSEREAFGLPVRPILK